MFNKFKIIIFASIFVFGGFSVSSQEINSEKVNYNLAVNNIQSGNYKEATDYLLKVIRLNPSNSQAHYNLGLCYKKLGSLNLAFEEFNKAFELINPASDYSNPIDLETKHTTESNEIIKVSEKPKEFEHDKKMITINPAAQNTVKENEVKSLTITKKTEPNIIVATKEVNAPAKTIPVAEKTEPNVKIATKEVKAPAKTISVAEKTEPNV
ncbi:MAG: tetratricopeptide repeat protein, partial [bacterium]